jgi:DNA gyrase subunit A
VTTLTRGGQIKKTEVIEYENYREKGIIGVKIADDDQLLTATLTDGNQEFLIATKMGQSIRFHESQVRSMGRGAGGVKAIELEGEDEVVGLAQTEPERNWVLAVCERGYGKRTALDEFRAQNRGGKGIILIDCSDRNGPVVGIALVKPEDEIMLITDRGQTIRTAVDGVRETGRNAQGVKLMSIGDDERVVAFEPIGESQASAVLESGSIPPEAMPEGEMEGVTEDAATDQEADGADAVGQGDGDGETDAPGADDDSEDS